jgi:hypothetical protein
MKFDARRVRCKSLGKCREKARPVVACLLLFLFWRSTASAIAPLQSPVVPVVATFTWRLEREIPAGRKLTFYHAPDVRLTVDGHACPRGWYESQCYAPNAASELTIAVWSTREVWTTVLAIVWHGGRVDRQYLTNPALIHRLYYPWMSVNPEP